MKKTYPLKGEVSVAQQEEAEEVIALLKEVAAWLKEKGEKQWESVLNGEDEKSIIQAIQQKQTYIIRRNTQLIATFTIYFNVSTWDRMLWGNTLEEAAYLHKLAVHPTETGKGLGKQILVWVEEYVRDNNILKLRLDCVEDNGKLNTFYTSHGYRKAGSRHGFSLFEKDVME